MGEAAGRVFVEVDDRGKPGSVGRIVVDYQPKLNILNSRLIGQFLSAIEQLKENERLRAVVLTGAGDRAFIGGADVREMAQLDPESARAFITQLHRVCEGLRLLPVPVIARIRGYCLGGGLEIAAACDLRAASTDSRFGMPEVNVGIPSVIEAALLPQLIGWGRTRELVYTGAIYPAEDAARWGLIERLTAPEDLDAAVEGWIESILVAGPSAIRAQKALIREWEALPVGDAIQRGIAVFGDAYETGEPERMMSAFLEGRTS